MKHYYERPYFNTSNNIYLWISTYFKTVFLDPNDATDNYSFHHLVAVIVLWISCCYLLLETISGWLLSLHLIFIGITKRWIKLYKMHKFWPQWKRTISIINAHTNWKIINKSGFKRIQHRPFYYLKVIKLCIRCFVSL